jgi:hypothetical protein
VCTSAKHCTYTLLIGYIDTSQVCFFSAQMFKVEIELEQKLSKAYSTLVLPIVEGIDSSRADGRSRTGRKAEFIERGLLILLFQQTTRNLTTKECFFWTPRIARNMSGPRCNKGAPGFVKLGLFKSGTFKDPLEPFVTVGIERIVDFFDFGFPCGLFNLRTRPKGNWDLPLVAFCWGQIKLTAIVATVGCPAVATPEPTAIAAATATTTAWKAERKTKR